MASSGRNNMYYYRLGKDTNKKYLNVTNSGGPYYRHLHRLAEKFSEAQRAVPINWFWWRMALILNPDGAAKGRGYTTGQELYAVCRQRAWGQSGPNVFPQQLKTGMMTDFRKMSEAAYKMCNPECWPLQEVSEEGDTGQIEFLVVPTLLAMDRVMQDANRASGGGPNVAPSSDYEYQAVQGQMNQHGLKRYYVKFREYLAKIFTNSPISDQVWKEAVGWDDSNGYHIGKLTAALQRGGKLRRALGMTADSQEGRMSSWLMFHAACPFLKSTPPPKNLHWPPLNVKSGQRGSGGQRPTMRIGTQRNTTGQLLIQRGYENYAYMWKFSEEHLPIQPISEPWVWFYGNPGIFKKVVTDLNAFLAYSIKLANGQGSYLGLQNERTRRTWGLVCARRLVFLIDELGILDENVCGRQDPFAMLAVNRTSNDVETIYDPKALARKFAGLARLAKDCTRDDLELQGRAGSITWCDVRTAQTMFARVAKWVALLKHEKLALTSRRAADADRYWADQARELASGELGRGVSGRPVVAPELLVVASASDSSRPPAEKRPEPDDPEVVIDNTPAEDADAKVMLSAAGAPIRPPNNDHNRDQIDGIAVPALEAVGSQNPSVPPSQPAGVARPPGRDRDHSKEQGLAGAGPMQNAAGLSDDDEEMKHDNRIVHGQLSGAGNQGARPFAGPSGSFGAASVPSRPGRGRERSGSKRRCRDEDMSLRRSKSRSRSRGPARPLIANHPQADVVNMDVAKMLEQVIAHEIEQQPDLRNPEEVAKRVKEMFGELGQPQQSNTKFQETVRPVVTGSGDDSTIEASGYFLFDESHDGRKYGIVAGYRGPQTMEAASFLVMVVGGARDGDFERVSDTDGIYKAGGMFPVLSIANPATAHGKISRFDISRLERQRLGINAELLKQMARREIRLRAEDGSRPYSTLAGDGISTPPSEEQIQSYASELVSRIKKGDVRWNMSSTDSLWIDLGCARKWGQVLNHKFIILRTLRNYMEQMWDGRARPLPVDTPTLAQAEPMCVDDGDHGQPPSDFLNFLSGWDSTSIAVIITIIIVVCLLLFSD